MVIDGASTLLEEVFGEKEDMHGSPRERVRCLTEWAVEVEAIFEVD